MCGDPCKEKPRRKHGYFSGFYATCGKEECILVRKSKTLWKNARTETTGVPFKPKSVLTLQEERRKSFLCWRCKRPKKRGRSLCDVCIKQEPFRKASWDKWDRGTTFSIGQMKKMAQDEERKKANEAFEKMVEQAKLLLK